MGIVTVQYLYLSHFVLQHCIGSKREASCHDMLLMNNSKTMFSFCFQVRTVTLEIAKRSKISFSISQIPGFRPVIGIELGAKRAKSVRRTDTIDNFASLPGKGLSEISTTLLFPLGQPWKVFTDLKPLKTETFHLKIAGRLFLTASFCELLFSFPYV